MSCYLCKHLKKDGLPDKCEAFPGGIPFVIMSGEKNHDEEYGTEKTINGKPILFEKIEIKK